MFYTKHIICRAQLCWKKGINEHSKKIDTHFYIVFINISIYIERKRKIWKGKKYKRKKSERKEKKSERKEKKSERKEKKSERKEKKSERKEKKE